jgi:hypothetical protein
MKFVAIIHRRLREGKTYDDYCKAWFHTNGFGVPTTMYSVINALNPREIISIGIIETELDQLPKIFDIDIDERSKSLLNKVIEETIIRHFGVMVAEDDFSSAGTLAYQQAQVDGKKTNFDDIEKLMHIGAEMLTKAGQKRDEINRKKRGK